MNISNLIKFPDNSSEKDTLYFYLATKIFENIPSTLTIYYDIESNKFWNYINNVSTDVLNRENSFININSIIDEETGDVKYDYDYFLNLDDNLYCSFIQTLKVEEDEGENKNEIELASNIRFYIKCNKNASSILKKINDQLSKIYYVEDNSNKYNIISSTAYGYRLQPAKAENVELDIELNYGKKFVKKHDKIINSLKNDKKGLVLLHGEPGTGKTTYIRYLIKMLSEYKTIIFVPPYLISQISSPEFISFITTCKNSILILEEAEMALGDRNSYDSDKQAVSNILNITDGILNDLLNIQIIASFNIDKQNIDKALLRNGRLIEQHYFSKLSAEDATKLSEHLNYNKVYTKDTNLVDIYNHVENVEDNDNKKNLKNKNKKISLSD